MIVRWRRSSAYRNRVFGGDALTVGGIAQDPRPRPTQSSTEKRCGTATRVPNPWCARQDGLGNGRQRLGCRAVAGSYESAHFHGLDCRWQCVVRAIHLIFCLLILTACASEDVTVKLPGATRTDIPVFEPSRVEESLPVAFSTGTDFYDEKNWGGVSWTLSTNRPMADVIAFYEQVSVVVSEDEESAQGVGEDVAGQGLAADGNADNANIGTTLLDLPGRRFRLESVDNVDLEVTVYVQPKQRRVWFTIIETAEVAGS